MLVDPRAALAGDEARALHMGRRRGELRDEDVAVLVEHLGFRDVGEGVEVKPVGGRAVRLVAGDDAARATPVRPDRKRVEDEVGQRLAVVVAEAELLVLRAARARECGQVVAQVVAALRLERLEQGGRPRCAVVFIGVVVERARGDGAGTVERNGERLQVLAHGVRRERVDHQPLAGSGRAFYLDSGRHGIEGHAPAFFVLPFPQKTRPGLLGLLAVPHARKMPAAVFLRDPWSAEAPAASHGEIDAEALRPRRFVRRVEEPRPLLREVRDLRVLLLLGLVDRNHVVTAHAGLGELLRLKLKPRPVDGAAHPPVVRPRAHFLRDGRPRGFGGGKRLHGYRSKHECKFFHVMTFLSPFQIR